MTGTAPVPLPALPVVASWAMVPRVIVLVNVYTSNGSGQAVGATIAGRAAQNGVTAPLLDRRYGGGPETARTPPLSRPVAGFCSLRHKLFSRHASGIGRGAVTSSSGHRSPATPPPVQEAPPALLQLDGGALLLQLRLDLFGLLLGRGLFDGARCTVHQLLGFLEA